MIKLENVSYSHNYKSPIEKEIYNDVNLEIKGQKNILVGFSGSGKSTLYRLLLKELKPQKGKIMIPKHIGFVFQNVNTQIITSTVYDEINLGYQNRFKSKISRSKVQDQLGYFKLEITQDADPKKLSGGQKKLMMLIAILVTEPNFLILDEPFVGLDNKKRKTLITFLEQTKIPYLISTHDIEDNYNIYDSILVIDHKKIKKTTIQEVFNQEYLRKPRSYNG